MKKKMIADLIMNVAIVLSVGIGMSVHIALGVGSGMDGEGWETFQYFTNLSNIFCAIIALIVVIYEIRMLAKKEEKELPRLLMAFRQIATVGVFVTFAIVAFIFLPAIKFDFAYLYADQKIMTHFTTPLLAIFSFIFFTKGKAFDWKGDFFSIIPELIYGIVYEIEVPVLGNWEDFYNFTLGGKWYAPFIVFPAICGIAYLCSFILSITHNKAMRNSEKR